MRGGINASAAEIRGAEFDVPAVSVARLLADPTIEIVVNLTVPKAHVEVGLQAIAAGKHVHSEKPLGIAVAEASRLLAPAAAKGLRVGCAAGYFSWRCAPDLPQAARRRRHWSADCRNSIFMCPGHEDWHPNPGFLYLAGGGPMLDMGPYYIASLVNLLGPIKQVAAITSRIRDERLVTSEPLKGDKIPVEVATHVAGTMEFVAGVIVTLAMSFDVARHSHRPIELYGTHKTLAVPDPDYFGGQIEIAAATKDWLPVATEHAYADGDYRIIGVADMAHAIRSNRAHRASGELAFHVLEVMEAFQRSSDRGVHIEIDSRPARPATMPSHLSMGLLD